MALTPPTVEDLGKFRNEEFADTEVEWAGSVLQQATDALWAVTGLENAPADERAHRVMDYALMDLALWLMAQGEHREEINSPFSGERIGSYSYQKMQQAQRGEETGLYWLDLFFQMLAAPGTDAARASVSSEHVFNPDGLTYAQQDAYDKARSATAQWWF